MLRSARLSVTGGIQTEDFNPSQRYLFFYYFHFVEDNPIVWIGAVLSLVSLLKQKWEQRFAFCPFF